MKEVTRAIVLDSDGRVLLGKRARGHGEGQWALVGGKPDNGESMKECVVREVHEELNVVFYPTFIKKVLDDDSVNEPWNVYLYKGLFTGKIKFKEDEISEIGFFEKTELNDLEIAFNHMELLKEYFGLK